MESFRWGYTVLLPLLFLLQYVKAGSFKFASARFLASLNFSLALCAFLSLVFAILYFLVPNTASVDFQLILFFGTFNLGLILSGLIFFISSLRSSWIASFIALLLMHTFFINDMVKGWFAHLIGPQNQVSIKVPSNVVIVSLQVIIFLALFYGVYAYLKSRSKLPGSSAKRRDAAHV